MISSSLNNVQLMRSTCRYEAEELQNLNNLFLPSLTSASYKRYAKKKEYNRQAIQVGRRFLESNGFMKEEIRSVSRRKPISWKDSAYSYL